MTKLRPPLSVEQALDKIAGHITWPEAALTVEKTERTVRRWSDPDDPSEITVKDALKLDAAFIAAGGGSAPLRDTYELLLKEAATAACSDSERLAQRAADAAKETGDAVSAIILAARPGASAVDKLIAARETREAISALSNTLIDLGGPEVPPPVDGAPQPP